MFGIGRTVAKTASAGQKDKSGKHIYQRLSSI